MGCCGCSLYASTITAGIFTLLDCALFLAYDILIIVFINTKDPSKIYDNSTFVEGFTYFKDDIKKFLFESLFLTGINFATNLKTFKTSYLLSAIVFSKISFYIRFGFEYTVEVLLGLRIALRFIWLLSSIALFIGNSREYRKYLYAWELLTLTRVIFGIGTSIYSLVKFMEDMITLFDKDNIDKWNTQSKLVAEFTILINFLELGPIWLIMFIALVIFVHQRGLEIKRKKGQLNLVNNWGSMNYNNINGHLDNKSSRLAHPYSLTQEPNQLSISKLEENQSSKVSTVSSVEPILQVNDVITIPRVRNLIPPKDYNEKANTQKINNQANARRFSNTSALAKRSSYLFNESGRDMSKVPKRNHSYNYGQRPVNNNAYDNKAFQGSNNDLYKPISIKRPSMRK